MIATPAPYVAVMDGDLQHDDGILPAMLERIHNEMLDLVVAAMLGVEAWESSPSTGCG